MTQEWFESADLDKTAINDKKESPSDPVIPEEELKEKEELPVVEENSQAIPEDKDADLEKVEAEEQEAEEEELATKTDKSEKPVKEVSQTSKPLTSKSLESPFLPDPTPTKTAIFKEELADFWTWLLGALKEPTARFDTDKKHSYNAFALLTIFSATSFLFTVYHAKHSYYGHMASIDANFVEQFPSLNLFSILMGGFVVKRFVDQDSDWTLERAFQEYGRIFALPILLTGVASFFAFFNGLRFAALLCLISIGMLLLGNLYIISRPSKDSSTDPFYRLLLAVLVNGSVLFLFFLAEMALISDYLRILAFM